MPTTIPPETAERLLQADLANIVKKLKAGKTLTRGERSRLQEAESGEPTHVTTLTKLAAILGVTRHTLRRWRDEYDDAPSPASDDSHDVVAWREFVNRHGLKGYEDGPEEEVDGLPTEPLLKRRRLDLWCKEKAMHLELRRAELIEADLVREVWKAKAEAAEAKLRALLDEELAKRLEGAASYDIFDELVAVVDEFNRAMHEGG